VCKRNVSIFFANLALVSALALPVHGAYDVDWWTADGGGALWTTGGDWLLSGTTGQPDARATMVGGEFELSGGFWMCVSGPAVLVGDLNCDGRVNFGDVTPFVIALSDPDRYAQQYPNCPFGNRDINGDGLFNFADINPFVQLLSGR
jgi:hypothetical protein